MKTLTLPLSLRRERRLYAHSRRLESIAATCGLPAKGEATYAYSGRLSQSPYSGLSKVNKLRTASLTRARWYPPPETGDAGDTSATGTDSTRRTCATGSFTVACAVLSF